MHLKQILVVPVLLSVSIIQAQSDATYKTTQQLNYLKKSKAQKTAAVTLLSVGGGFFVVGCIGALSSFSLSFSLNETNANNSKNDPTVGFAILGGAGVLMSFTSIPLFHAARKNKKRAAHAVELSLKMEQARLFKAGEINSTNYPSLRLGIGF